MLRACRLWEKTSAKGETYLVGRLGGVRVLVFRSREEGPDASTHTLMFSEAPPKKDEPREKPQGEGEKPF